MITRKKNGRSEAFRTVEPRIPAIFPLGILEVLPSRLRPAELQGLPRVHEGFQLPCSPPTVPPGPGEHVKLAEIREREPKGKSLGWKFRRKGRSMDEDARLHERAPSTRTPASWNLPPENRSSGDEVLEVPGTWRVEGGRWRARPLPPPATPN